MKTAILTISLALASAFSALAQTVMRENSIVYYQTNVFLHDDAVNPLHHRISNEADPVFVGSAAYSITTNMTTNWNRLLDIYSVNSGMGVYKFIGGNVEYGAQLMYQTSTNESDIATYYSAEVGYEEVSDEFALFSFRGQYPTMYWEWRGRINDTEASRIKAIPTNTIILTQTSRLYSDGTNLFFVSTVSPGFTNALTTNSP